MAEEPGTVKESSTMQMIGNVLSDLKPKGSELEIVPLEAGKVVRIDEATVEEAPTDRGLETGVHDTSWMMRAKRGWRGTFI